MNKGETMKIRMTETYLLEADSIEELEEQYAIDDLDFAYSYREFESIKFEEVKEQKKMITLMPEQYGELVEKAVRFDILKAQAQDNKYLSDWEKAIFGFVTPAPAVPVEEDDF